MKKFLAVVSLVSFIAVTSHAQTTQATAPVTKEATAVKATAEPAAAPAATHSCCKKPNAACCTNNSSMKSCTPAQKAACEKAATEKASAEKEAPAKAQTKATVPATE